MAKIKVLHIIKSLGRGGAEMLLQETMKIHHHDEFEFHCIYFLPWKNQMVEGIQNAGGKVTLLKATNNISLLLNTRKIIAYIRSNQIDIVHCHLPWAGFAGRLVYKTTGIPVIYTEHNKQERYHWITRLLNSITFNWQKKAIAVSSDVLESIQKNIAPSVPVDVILNGVNTANFVRDYTSGNSLKKAVFGSVETKVIGNIAVFRFQKRIKEWITLFKQIHQKHPDVRGCILGDGVLKQEIMQHLQAEGMTEFIHFPGLQTDVIPWLSAMDIFMMTSEFEGLPIALLEAMSMKCAIVSTAAGGIKEVIRDGEDGFTKPVSQWQELVAPLDFLLNHPQEIIAYGEKARLRAEHSFSLQKMVEETERQYRLLYSKSV